MALTGNQAPAWLPDLGSSCFSIKLTKAEAFKIKFPSWSLGARKTRRLVTNLMKLNYDPETDSLYIHLRDIPSVDSREISDGLILDFDADGVAVGIDIQHAGKMADIHFLTTTKIPYELKK